jgi:activating signal cointegrator 1
VKALSLWQPWASLIALRVKTVETRSWRTSYRGPLAIHATKRVPWKSSADEGERAAAMTGEIPRPLWEAMRAHVDEYPLLWAARLPRGVIVATCQLVDVLPITGPNDAGHDEFVCPDIGGGLTLYRFENGGMYPATVDDDITSQIPYGDFSEGRYAWILDDITACDPPVEASGRQGLWEWAN